MVNRKAAHVVIIGAGFCGLAAGYELSKRGVRVTIIEKDEEIGGLAGSFHVNGVRLEKFYHHWFSNDKHVMTLIDELGMRDQVILRTTRTGMYYANNFFKLSTPLDLLRFTPLSVLDRFRLGLLTLRVRRVDNWRQLENLTAEEWLRENGGDKVYEVVWAPLLRGKFGEYASDISAVWFWNKLKLRGGSRGKGGKEQLAYYRGGFSALSEEIATRIKSAGGTLIMKRAVDKLLVHGGNVIGVESEGEQFQADAVIATPALPIIADLVEPHVSKEYTEKLRRTKYLSNVCLILELDRSLSDTYWLNVNDPDFPFVAVIEHTNFEPRDTYGGRNIVYLSKYLPESSELFRMQDNELLEYTIPHLQRMFPDFKRGCIIDYHVWRAYYSQPVVERHYSALIPAQESTLSGLFLATMAQIYPEDRGTNYAIAQGRKIAEMIADKFR